MASLRSPHSQLLNRIKPSAFPSSKRTLPSLSTHHRRLPTDTNQPHSRNSFSCITSPKTSFLARFFSSTPRNPAMAAAAKTKVQGLIDQYPIVVFSKTYCPYCKATKSLLAEKVKDKSKLHIIELDNESDGSEMQAALGELTGQTSVPNIFINKKHIGGNDKLQALNKNGELDPLLKQASVL